ncbi:hypothetical protein HPP92_021045 [Vanilla planifolia]|uniref:catalase n=1 Tax=Vanilla planifolia TaxID=51239 RepID=A0A835UGR2_VANPL|nr:hypothetical protein HPP92_021045 [Vanilla planifolia]
MDGRFKSAEIQHESYSLSYYVHYKYLSKATVRASTLQAVDETAIISTLRNRENSILLLVLSQPMDPYKYRPSSAYNSQFWTTNSGAPVWCNSSSLTVGARGPILLEDYHLIENLPNLIGRGFLSVLFMLGEPVQRVSSKLLMMFLISPVLISFGHQGSKLQS